MHGIVHKCSLEQQFHKSNMVTFVVLKFWSHAPSVSGSFGRQSDKNLVDSIF